MLTVLKVVVVVCILCIDLHKPEIKLWSFLNIYGHKNKLLKFLSYHYFPKLECKDIFIC